MTEDRPTAAYTLALVGAILQVVGAVFYTYMVAYWWGYTWWGAMGPWMMGYGPWGYHAAVGYGWWLFSLAFLVLVVGLGFAGAFFINNSNPDRVRTGSILVLVAAVLAFPTMFGLLVGSLLMIIGAILGLTWQPPQRAP